MEVREVQRWKGKKVVWFNWQIYKGFYPDATGEVIEETDEECLVKLRWNIFGPIYINRWVWAFKYDEKAVGKTPQYQARGYCKLIW